MTVSKDKQYRTKEGNEVRIYATDGIGNYLVHGAVKGVSGWDITSWEANGSHLGSYTSPMDLVEVKPEIHGFMNVYSNPNWTLPSDGVAYPGTSIFADRSLAEAVAQCAAAKGHTRIACLSVTFHEGEGLE